MFQGSSETQLFRVCQGSTETQLSSVCQGSTETQLSRVTQGSSLMLTVKCNHGQLPAPVPP